MKIWIVAVFGVFVVSALACAKGPCGLPENELQGSVSELFDIDVDRVRVRRADSQTVFIEYIHGADYVAKVAADTRSFSKGIEIPLSDGSVRRITSPETNYPSNIERGTVTFETELTVGEEAAGCFNVLFNMPDHSQRTLEGGFRAKFEG